MSIELVLGGIGTLLGIANFIYWAWWAKRDKVLIVNSEVYPVFIPKGSWVDKSDGSRICLHNCAELSIEASCELVLANGQKEIEVKEVEVVFNQKILEKLREYFVLPFPNKLHLHHLQLYKDEQLPQTIVLEPKKTVPFKREVSFNCTNGFQEEYEKMEDGCRPDYILSILDEIENRYQIRWTRYDGKRLSWRFPDRWYRNLGKKLWG